MIKLKSKEEIKVLREGGEILSRLLQELRDSVKVGVFTDELERRTKELIAQAGATAAFLGYKPSGDTPYPSALCLSINDEIVHGPAIVRRKIKDGDIVSLDLGIKYKGLFTDMATTVAVGEIGKKEQELLSVTKKALKSAIEECKPGLPISVIGKKIEQIVGKAGFGIVRDLVGHGVGFEVHEGPMVPNFYEKAMDKIIMEEGLVIAIEPMVTLSGSEGIKLGKGGWVYKTTDGSVAAHFEATVAITKDGAEILTPIV